jgi:hypothetical protein
LAINCRPTVLDIGVPLTIRSSGRVLAPGCPLAPAQNPGSGGIYGKDATARPLEDALTFNAFSSEYIAQLLQARARCRTEPASPLSLTRRAGLLELDLPEPDLSVYEAKTHE